METGSNACSSGASDRADLGSAGESAGKHSGAADGAARAGPAAGGANGNRIHRRELLLLPGGRVLLRAAGAGGFAPGGGAGDGDEHPGAGRGIESAEGADQSALFIQRSEERRVGKESRSPVSPRY